MVRLDRDVVGPWVRRFDFLDGFDLLNADFAEGEVVKVVDVFFVLIGKVYSLEVPDKDLQLPS